MTTLYLIRHGESHQDTLTDAGRVQAKYSALRFKNIFRGGRAKCYHSPAGRCVETARIFSEITGIPSSSHDLLHVITHHDTSAHRTFAEYASGRRGDAIILIGHDECRPHFEELVFAVFRLTPKAPYLRMGEIVRFSPNEGFVYC